MASNLPGTQGVPYLSIGIFAWNEERIIAASLDSLFAQTIFRVLRERGLKAEVICVANGCEDRTPEIAQQFFRHQAENHPDRDAFSGQVSYLAEAGKLNAWNQFVHLLSHPDATYLVMMDADILFQTSQTIANMLAVLEQDPDARVAVDRPIKEFAPGPHRSWWQSLSCQAAQITQAAPAQLCAQLYCIRSVVARNIYLPKDLAACEDGFIKAAVCSDFFTGPVNPQRIRMAGGAAHRFEAYTSARAILKNQKRQIIGQTLVHILVDQYLAKLPASRRLQLARTLRSKDKEDPAWMKRLIDAHLRGIKFFWNLYPGLLTHRFHQLRTLECRRKMKCLPAAVAGLLVSMISSLMAYRFLKTGSTQYWPKAHRKGAEPGRVPGSVLAIDT